MSNFSFAVLISGNGSNLGSMINHIKENKIPGKICCVVSNNPEAYGIQRAKDAGIPYEIINNKEFKSREEFDYSLVKKLKKYKPDLIVLAGFMRILSNVFIEAYDQRILNIHPSLLPKHPGLNTHKRAIESGDKYHGITIHFVDDSLDGGPICAQSKIKINDSDQKKLETRIHLLEHELYPKVIRWYAEGRLEVNGEFVTLDNKKITLN